LSCAYDTHENSFEVSFGFSYIGYDTVMGRD